MIIKSIEAEYQRYRALAEATFDQLTDDELSAPGPNGGNSIAIVVWHVSGNLASRFTDFLSTDGEKPWRQREEEFDDRRVTRAELLAKWNHGWDVLFATLATLSEADFGRTVTIRQQPLLVHEALQRSVTHTSYHVGQIVYLGKMFRGGDWRSLSIPGADRRSTTRRRRGKIPSATRRPCLTTVAGRRRWRTMTRYIAFLRAINVGGHVVRMDQLRQVFVGLGFSGVETFIASGNVVFHAKSTNARSLEGKIEKALEKALGYEVATFLRTDRELAAVAAHQPFKPAEMATAGALNVAFLADELDARTAALVTALANDNDVFRVHGRELYWLCRTRQSDSKFSNVLFERTTRQRATFRGVKTIQKMAAKFCGPPSP